MVDDKKVKRIVEYFSKKREVEQQQLAIPCEQTGAVASLQEKQFSPVPKDKESGLPKKYVSGLPSSVASARKKHWNTNKKKDPSDSSAYTPAPGDRNAKTKPSQYTKKYHTLYGEDIDIELTEAAHSALAKKAEKSGVSLSTLKKVYARGVAAWRTGHRPGTTPQQWGFARVNSYITKGKTYHTADKDLRENFQDGRNPEDKGDMARHGLKGKTISQLKKVRSSSKASPRQKQLAHWFINMHKDK